MNLFKNQIIYGKFALIFLWKKSLSCKILKKIYIY